MRTLILSALILTSAFQTAMGAVEGQWTYIIENGGATIIGSTATGAVMIPNVLGGYAVKKVGNGHPPIFGVVNDSVTSVVIPNGVTSIGVHAFSYCQFLTSVTIPNSVTSIGIAAFGSTGLRSVTIPHSVTSIGISAFEGCASLASITFAPTSSVTSIGVRAFAWCGTGTGLTGVTIPNSVTSIGNEAFQGCTTLSSVYLPVRFETTYPNFGLTASQVSFYDPSSISYLAGQQSVIANPNTHNLYTTSQIQNMAVGDLVLTKNVGGTFTLNYDIEQSADLQTWTTYAPLSLPLTGLPTDKAFVRIKAKQ